MDGLVTNTSLIAGVGGGGSDTHMIVLSGVAGLVAGAFSMALGEFTSVTTQNEQVDTQVDVERRALDRHPDAELAELVDAFTDMGMSTQTAEIAASEVHRDNARALAVHLTQELGLNPDEQPSPWVAAGSSFVTFSAGALIPILPFLFGFTALAAGLTLGGLGLLVVGAVTARYTGRPMLIGAVRQLLLGGVAVAATYGVGSLIGVGIA
ncbi:VIT1/CCC1 transporter family protein [Skermania piniformis]|uniref:VIT1/CCC1 transporter family protein n=2 Tax=Skermania pinensis TaxID=39122 RepID=A0ABX8SG39_9ACTN|nr:VIT1/CCC1 transporter family protein [Skermania piniformis]